MDNTTKHKKRRRTSGDLFFSKSSSPRNQIRFRKNLVRCTIVVIYGSACLSSSGRFSLFGRKTPIVASAFLNTPTITSKQKQQQPSTRHAGKRNNDRSHHSFAGPPSTTSRTPSQLASSTNGDTEREGSWRSNLPRDVYASPLLWEGRAEWVAFLKQFGTDGDPLWEQVKLEALTQLSTEPEAGPQLYQSILSQGSLLEALVSIIANEVQSELVPATQIKQLFLDNLTPDDAEAIRCDVIAAATRSPSVELAVLAILFHTGLHALVCYRAGHRLWNAERTGLAKYLQSTVSGHYSADIHPACSMGQGIYLCSSAGVVIGETATVGNDVSILHGVTLGGTGKELGDRHPKVQHGVILKDCATVLGNIPVGTGAVVMAKAIVNKPVPPLAIMSGVPAKVVKTRELSREAFHDDLEEHLAFKYLDEWKELEQDDEEAASSVDAAVKSAK